MNESVEIGAERRRSVEGGLEMVGPKSKRPHIAKLRPAS